METKPLTLSQIEQDVLKFWADNDIFTKVNAEHANDPDFVFYDGPPFANGLPHYGHITQMAVKDAVLRYKTMLGFKVPRKIGWDTHGLPVEYQLEKELGLSGKKSIQDFGVDKFVEAARSSVLRYSGEWVSTMERMGRWMDLQNPYTTMDNSYIESVWWAFSELHKKGLIYDDYRVGPYCSRCGTVLSNFEVNLGYKDDVSDPSVYVKLRITNGRDYLRGAYLLVWTTTPWTLPVNMAVAVDPKSKYVLVEHNHEKFVVAEALLNRLFNGEATVIESFEGEDLISTQYESLYTISGESFEYKVVSGHHVSLEDGTGVVHMAPAHGEDDFKIGKAAGLPIVSSVEPDGKLKTGFSWPGEGEFFKKADQTILSDLESRGVLFKQDVIKHTYPFCWRCDTPLLYFPSTSWYVAVTKIKDELISENKTIKWQPEHIRDGRFGKWLEGARDWAISRDRFWGAPIPVWQCDGCKHSHVFGAKSEIESLGSFDLNDLHRPYIDAIEWRCKKCQSGTMKRVPFVFDCWFESGSMPFAQFGYPIQNHDHFNAESQLNYPADFIVEALDQTRGWFYTLHVLGVALFGKAAFKAVDVNGLILAGDGKKLSKKLRNYTEPEVLFENEGVDAFRLFVLTATAIGEEYRFSDDAVRDVRRRWLTPLLNVVSYFELSKQVTDDSGTPEHYAKLDDWMKARVAEARAEVFAAMDGDDRHAPYDLVRACRTFGPLVEDLSTWYVRLCRGRTDKAFTDTLQNVLVEISTTYAPFLPFVSEFIYQKFSVKGAGLPESVHLRFCEQLNTWHDDDVIKNMSVIREIVTLARSLRANLKIPNRQPLNKILCQSIRDIELLFAVGFLRNELNVKEFYFSSELPAGVGEFPVATNDLIDLKIWIDPTITDELKAEGNANELRRVIQDMRKSASLSSGDRAEVAITGLTPDIKRYLEPQLKTTRLVATSPVNEISSVEHDSWRITLGRL